jgi:hypothetical protein
MEDSTRGEADQRKRKISHVLLIKLLMVEELRRLGNNWNLFLLATGIPKDTKEYFPLPTERVTSCHAEAEAGRDVEKGRTLESLSPQKPIPRKRGRPRKNKKIEETRILSKPRVKLVVEESLMRDIHMEPIEGTSRESLGGGRRIDTKNTNVRESS